jgi:hypothetical protein
MFRFMLTVPLSMRSQGSLEHPTFWVRSDVRWSVCNAQDLSHVLPRRLNAWLDVRPIMRLKDVIQIEHGGTTGVKVRDQIGMA